MIEFTREFLWELRDKARDFSELSGLNTHWKRAYEAIMDAADRLDAMIARSTIRETSIEETEKVKSS